MTVHTRTIDEIDPSEIFGSPLERREDPALITGDAEYVDDIHHPGTAFMAVARSQYGHARIEGVDTSAAEERDDVLAVYTHDDVAASDVPGTLAVWVQEDYAHIPDRPILADGRTRFQGEPIAVVVAESRYAAADAAALVEVSYDRLDAVTDPVEAVGDEATPIHDDAPDNVALEWEHGDEEAVDAAFADAADVVELDLENNRLIPTAMETRAAVARYDADDGRLTVEMTSQNPHLHKEWLAETLGLDEDDIRVRAPAVGGGFGSKIHHYPEEALVSFAAMELDRPIKWQATRTEGFSSTSHGRDHRAHAEIAFDDEGHITGLRTETHVGVGGYISSAQASVAAPDYAELLCGQYDVPAFYAHVTGSFTNTVPVDAYRGAGRPEATYLIERLMDRAAGQLDVDPVELRRRNFVGPDQFPYQAAAGREYDSGDYEKTLDLALDRADYEAFRERQAAAREEGRYLGIGFSCYIEACGVGPGLFEASTVEFESPDEVVVKVGTHSHGQGHETSFAQIVADRLGVPYDDIEVVEGDTDVVEEGRGTYGSRSAPVGGSAVFNSAEEVREKARTIAAHQLEVAPADLEFEAGAFHVAGAPERSITIREVADIADDPDELPDDVEPGLRAHTSYDPPNFVFPFGTHVAVVEVDPASGEIEFERYVAVDDVGTQINPKLVEGQIHGGIAQGLGQALYEGAQYDANGTLVTGSLQDYAVPKAMHLPEMETESTVTPCPHNPLGVKGVGEAGTIAAPPAAVNAVVDALSPRGVTHVDMPLTAERVWTAADRATVDGGSDDDPARDEGGDS
ncbi:xanthine dehydrogenase family protein molybdopterin-binding subunit [Salinigranum salinum]|uniref:xanthine dehydrogenase family protein molybdopterin-binding subunit n=1 Tax=Salinigranum salinum TaxID=1364937 RepID=UPI001260AED6|nr:xanthine dehydrogenase family protein molybdopterin-binding subunit [Salinigranum salinum]